MFNNLEDIKRRLRYISKKNKFIKYSIGLVVTYAMLGIGAFASDINEPLTKEELRDKVVALEKQLEEIKAKNKIDLDASRLELVELVEQGDHAVKSPWKSWQFGMNYIYNNWRGEYKGYNNKGFEGVYKRDPWWISQLNPNSEKYKEYFSKNPIDPNAIVLSAATTSTRGNYGEEDYGITKLNFPKEKPTPTVISVNVKDRKVEPVKVNFEKPEADVTVNLNIPSIDVPTFSPKAPEIKIPAAPVVPVITTPGAGGGNGGLRGFWFSVVPENKIDTTLTEYKNTKTEYERKFDETQAKKTEYMNEYKTNNPQGNMTNEEYEDAALAYARSKPDYQQMVADTKKFNQEKLVPLSITAENLRYETDQHAILSEIDMLEGTIEGYFETDKELQFKANGLLLQTANNGQASLTTGSQPYASVPLTNPPFSKPFYSDLVKGANDKFEDGSVKLYGRADQAIIKHVDTAVAKYKPGTKIIATNNVQNPKYGKQILHYDEHYYGSKYNLKQLFDKEIITEEDKNEWKKYLNLYGIDYNHKEDNRSMQIVENAGDWYLRGHKIMAVNLQAHSGSSEKNSFFRNVGTITGLNEASKDGYLGEHVAFMLTEGYASQEHRGFDNLGNIEMRAPKSVLFHYHDSPTTGSFRDGIDAMINSGNAKMYGRENVGFTAKKSSNFILNSAIILNRPVTLLGDSNIGAVINKEMFFDKFKIKFDVGTEDPLQYVKDEKGKDGLLNSGNIEGNSDKLTDKTIGLYAKKDRLKTSNYAIESDLVETYKNTYKSAEETLNKLRNGETTSSINMEDEKYYEELIEKYKPKYEKWKKLYDENNAELTALQNECTEKVNEYEKQYYEEHKEEYDQLNEKIKTLQTENNDLFMEVWNLNTEVGTLRTVLDKLEAENKQNEQEYIDKKAEYDAKVQERDQKQAKQEETQKKLTEEFNKKIELDAPRNEVTGKMWNEWREKNIEKQKELEDKYLEETLLVDIKDLQINIGKYAKDSAGVNVEQAILEIGDQKAEVGAEIKNFIRHEGDLSGENATTTGNILAFVGENGELRTSFDTELSAKNTKDATAILVSKGKKVENKAKIEMENALDSKGIIIAKHTTPVEFENYNDIVIKGKNGIAIANYGGKFKQMEKAPGERTKIEVEGDKGIAVYNNGAEPLEINSADIKIDKGATGLFADGTSAAPSEIKLNNTNATVGEKGLLFFNYAGSGTDPVGKFTFLSDSDITVEREGVLFYNRGTVSTLPSFLDMLVGDNGTKNLNIRVKDGARIFVLDDPNTELRLSSLPTSSSVASVSNQSGTVNLNFNIDQGAKYKYYTANGGTLYVDLPVNLDKETDAYYQNDIMSASVEVEKPMTNNGKDIAKGLKYAVAQKNSDITNLNRVKINVNNTITLTEKEGLIGVAAEGGKITNNSTITTVGDKNIGIVGTSNSEIDNNKDIVIGNEGVGILGTNQLSKNSEKGKFTIRHNAGATIKYQGDGKGAAYGIVARNNYKNNDTYTSAVNLASGSKIELENVAGSIGVLAQGKNLTVTDDGAEIKVGKKGRGYLIENSTTNPADEIQVALNGGKVVAKGDEAIAVYTNSKNLLESSKKVEVEGKKSIGYYTENGIHLKTGADLKVGESTGADNEKAVGAYTNTKAEIESTVDVGRKSIGIYMAKNSDNAQTEVNVKPTAKLNVGEEAVGIYAEKSKVTLESGSKMSVNAKKGIGVYAVDESEVDDKATVELGENSYGFTLDNSKYKGDAARTINLDGNDSIFIYAKNNSEVKDVATLKGSGDRVVGIYSENSKIESTKDIDLSAGAGNIGIYAKGGEVKYKGSIKVGDSIIPEDSQDIYTAIGIAGFNGAKINVDSGSSITIKGNGSLGLYAKGEGTILTNNADITFEPDTSKYTGRMIGIYADDKAKVVNYGSIKTADSYVGNKNVEGIIGIGVSDAELENHGDITIKADGSHGIFLKKAVVKNYGTITVEGKKTYGITYDNQTKGADGQKINKDGSNLNGTANGKTGTVNASAGAENYLDNSYDPSKNISDIDFKKDANGKLVVNRDGRKIEETEVIPNVTEENVWMSEVGLYLDTLGRTKPIEGDGFDPSAVNDLIVGAEIGEITNAKDIRVRGENLGKFKEFMENNAPNVNVYSGSLSWTATYDDETKDILMSKLKYTDFTTPGTREYKFLDGLEQRYDANALDSKEKQVFNKLNSIGKNEGVLFTQATDEMLGNQYSTTALRINETNNILRKEFAYLRDEWDTESKNSSKVKVFGYNGEYNSGSIGIKNHKDKAYGVAYINENEDVTLGNSKGWYAGIVNNDFEFKDLGSSKENQLLAKVGLYKSVAFDKNNYTNWSIYGDVFAGINKMKRRYLIIDEVFGANSKYYTYGAALRNEVSQTYRASENVKLKAYGALDLEYGRHSKIEEKKGEVRLAIKSHDYLSVVPELGVQALYKKELKNGYEIDTKLKVAYSNELGRVASAGGKAKVNYTTAEYYDLVKEKEDRKGSVKTELSVGLNNSAWGVTANVGYDTKGKNVQAGLGLRVIF